MPLLKFPCGVQLGLWTRKTLWKSVKIQRMSTLVCGFFCIIMPCANIYFSHSQTFRQLVNTKIRSWRWRWEKIFDLQIHSRSFTIFWRRWFQHRSLDHGILYRFDQNLHHEQDGDANPEIVCSRWVNKRGDLILENRQIWYFINKMLFQ